MAIITLDEVKERKDYSKNTFTKFVLWVLNEAEFYTKGEAKDKWDFFKGIYDTAKDFYFPKIQKNTPTTNDNLLNQF